MKARCSGGPFDGQTVEIPNDWKKGEVRRVKGMAGEAPSTAEYEVASDGKDIWLVPPSKHYPKK
jgi:hypothetical protein